MHLFYSPDISGTQFELDEDESKHAVRVLRLKKGERVGLVDGKGGWYEAEIEDAHPKKCRFRILSHMAGYRPLPYHLHMAVSPTRSMERFEWFIEKATEIGISEISPLLCRRTERSRLNPERLDRVVVSAMKQSMRAYKPLLHPPVSFPDFIKVDREGTKGIAHCMAAERLPLLALPRDSSYTLLVGPEGDFTEDEVKLAGEAGYGQLHLGDWRLRTETAGVYICTAVSLLRGSSVI